jgi:hypothetical protein
LRHERLGALVLRTFGKGMTADDVEGLVAQGADHGLVGDVHGAHQRYLLLQAEVLVLLDEARGVRAGLHGEDSVDTEIGELPKVWAEVSRVQRMPELLQDLAA